MRSIQEQAVASAGNESSAATRISIITSSQLAGPEYAPRWLAEDCIRPGQPTILAGRAKDLKTTLAVSKAVSFAAGVPVFESCQVEAEKRVLYVSGEYALPTVRSIA